MTAAERLKQYEQLFQQSQQYDPNQFQNEFEKAYGEATNYNADLIGQRSEAIGQAQALPSELRASYAKSAVRNPLEQEALIATRRGNITSDISRLTDLLGARQSRYEDVLGNYLQAYQTDAQKAQTAMENSWRLYQDALAQEEAQRARAAAAAQQAAMADMMRSQFAQPQMVEEDLVIDTGDDRNWSDKFERSQTTPLAQTGFGQALGINTPDWVTSTPFGTFSNMIGNLIGNRNRPNTSFLDKLFDRR